MRTGEGEKGSATFDDFSREAAATAESEARRNRGAAARERPAACSVMTGITHRVRAGFRLGARSVHDRVRPPSSDRATALCAAREQAAFSRLFSSAQGGSRSGRAKARCVDKGGAPAVDGTRPRLEPYLWRVRRASELRDAGLAANDAPRSPFSLTRGRARRRGVDPSRPLGERRASAAEVAASTSPRPVIEGVVRTRGGLLGALGSVAQSTMKRSSAATTAKRTIEVARGTARGSGTASRDGPEGKFMGGSWCRSS